MQTQAMNISNRFRYLYFVIPKTASATVRHSLKSYTDIGYPVTAFEQHMTIEQFLKLDGATSVFDLYFKFSFVRNPYDRIYSGYMQDRLASVTWTKWIAAKKPIFDEIGDDFNRYLQEYVSRADVLHDWEWICFCPMTAFTHRDGEYALDWHGKVETLTTDLKALEERLGIKIQKAGDLNVRTKAEQGLKYLHKYTRTSVQLVNQLYRHDFDCFDYPMIDPGDLPDRLPA